MIAVVTLIILTAISCKGPQEVLSSTDGCCSIVIYNKEHVEYLDSNGDVIDKWLPQDFEFANELAECPEEMVTLDTVIDEYMEFCYHNH